MTLLNTPPPFDTQIPILDTTIAEAQKQFQNNFSTLFDAFGFNHVALNDPTNLGNHNVIQLIELSKGESTQSQEIAIYSKKVNGQTDQLFMRYPNNGKEFQLTEYQIYSIPKTNKQEAYFTFLPGKIIVYFGKVFSKNTNTFDIEINPPITKNISGVNIGCSADAIGFNIPQPNVSLIAYSDGLFRTLRLTAIAMLDNFYLFFGNL